MKRVLKPLSDYVVAVPKKPEDMTTAGIYLPKQVQERSSEADVVAIGSAVKNIKVGDCVIYRGYATTEVKLDDEYLLLKEEDILATIEEEIWIKNPK